MAFSLEDFINGNINAIDIYGGQADINNKQIRVLPGPIFQSDPLRMLRAYRFAATLGFAIEEKTLEKITTDSITIKKIARERVIHELMIYLGAFTQRLKTPISPRLLENIIPGINRVNEPINTNSKSKDMPGPDHLLKILEENMSMPDKIFKEYAPEISEYFKTAHHRALVKMAGLLHNLEDSAQDALSTTSTNRPAVPLKIMTELRMSNADAKIIDRIIIFQKRILNEVDDYHKSELDCRNIYSLVKSMGHEIISSLIFASSLCEAKIGREEKFNNALYNIYKFYSNRYLPSQNSPALLNGNDLTKIFKLKPSPFFKTIIENIEEARVLRVISTRKEAEARAQSLITEHKQE